MQINRWAFLALAWAPVSGTVMAKDVVVEVDATAGPWSMVVNRKLMPYGAGDQSPSAVVHFEDTADRIGIYADGTTSTPQTSGIGPSGIDGRAVDDTLGPQKKRYPSFYTPKVLYPANLHALTAVFVDDNGGTVGRPFMIGTGVRVPVPDTATGISFGFNDIGFSGNSGKLMVTVQLPDL